MIRDYNMLTKWHTPLRVAVSILLLIFCSTSLLREAIAAQETSQHKDIKAHWGYEPGNGPASWGKLNRDWLLCAEGNEQSPVDLTGARQEKFDEMTLAFPPANLKVGKMGSGHAK
jgi:carbonic anhydrase